MILHGIYYGCAHIKGTNVAKDQENFVSLITLEPASDMIKNGYLATGMDYSYLHLRYQGSVMQVMHFLCFTNRLPHLSWNWYLDDNPGIRYC